MARRGGGGGGSGGGMASPLIGVAVALLTFVILEIFAPTIAGTIQGAQPALSPTSEFNNSYRTATINLTVGTYPYGAPNGAWSINPILGPYNLTGGLGKSAVPSGADTWTVVVQIIGVVFLIIAIAIAVYYLKGMS
jgi:hypothetical protein